MRRDSKSPERESKCLNIIVNAEGNIKEISPWLTIYNKYIGKNIKILFQNDSSAFCKKIIDETNRVIQSHKPSISQIHPGCITEYHKEVIYWECSFYPLFLEAGGPYVLIQLEDVTNLLNRSKQIESIVNNKKTPFSNRNNLQTANRDLKLYEESYYLLIKNIKDYAVIILDERGFIMTWNQGAETIIQFKEEEIIGQHFSILYPEEDSKTNNTKKQLLLAKENGRYEEEGWKVKKDGSLFWSNCIINPIYNSAQVLIGYGVLTLDLTKIKELDKLKNEFTTMINHELKTPVTVIRGTLDLLENPNFPQQEDKKNKLISSCRYNCDRLIRLIENIIDLRELNDSKMIFKFRLLNLKSLIEESIYLCDFFSEKQGVRIIPDTLDDVFILGDADRLISVLNNLIHNAIKYSEPNDCVTVKMSHDSQNVAVEVMDNGPGIPKNFHSELFKSFKQIDSSTTRNHEGVGLGLTLCRAIIEKHTGKLDYESRPNKGSIFKIQLPISVEKINKNSIV